MYDSDWVDDFLFKSHFTDKAMKKGRDYDSQYAEEEEEVGIVCTIRNK